MNPHATKSQSIGGYIPQKITKMQCVQIQMSAFLLHKRELWKIRIFNQFHIVYYKVFIP